MRRFKYKLKKGGSRSVVLSIFCMQIILYSISFLVFSLDSDVSQVFVFIVIILDFGIIFTLIVKISKAKKVSKFTFIIYAFSTIFMIFAFTSQYMQTGVIIEDQIRVNDFSNCFYFSVITWTALGYGHIFPSHSARIWVMLEVFLGYIHMGILVGLILELATKNKPSS